jgi:hypothetical protein
MNTSYLEGVWTHTLRRQDVKTAVSNYNTGFFGKGEVRSYVYRECLRKVTVDGKLFSLQEADYDYFLNRCKTEVLPD